MVALSPLFWATLGLAATLGSVTVLLVVEVVRGHVSVTVPWGRRFLPLEQRTVSIQAPTEIVVDILRAAARGATPPVEEGEKTTVIDEEDDLIVNESVTRSVFGPVRAMELVRVTPDRVAYRHIAGPLPGTEEEFSIAEEDGIASVSYRGRIPISFWGLGRLVARVAIIPEYNRLIRLHMDALKQSAEAKARRLRRPR